MPFPEVLDSTIMSDFKSCPALCSLAHFQDWKPKVPSTHLHAGGAFAKGLEVARRGFYEGLAPIWKREVETGKHVQNGWREAPHYKGNAEGNAEYCIQAGVESLLAFYGDHQPPSYGTAANKTAIRMAGALESYFHSYPLNNETAYPILMPGGKRGIEFSFLHPLPIAHPETGLPLQYAGRADGIFQFAGGTYIFDDKTASQLGEQWAKQWKLRAQFSGYVWAAQQAGIRVDGVVVRGLAIYKNGYGTLEDISFRSEYMVSKWYEELLDWIDRMIHCYRTGRWQHNFDHSCSDFGGCQFLDICDREDPQPWLETGFERRHWDPVTRTETKL